MQNFAIIEKYIYEVRNVYEVCTSSFMIGNRNSQEFPVSKGLRKECPLAPTLFKVALEKVLKS